MRPFDPVRTCCTMVRAPVRIGPWLQRCRGEGVSDSWNKAASPPSITAYRLHAMRVYTMRVGVPLALFWTKRGPALEPGGDRKSVV